MRPGLALVAAAIAGGAGGYGAYLGWQHWSPPALMLDSTRFMPRAVAPAAPSAYADLATQAAGSAVASNEALPPTAIPDEVPDLRMPDLQGQAHSLRSYQGKPAIYNFWASWCAPCRREIPLLNAIQRDAGKNGLNVVGIAADLQSNVVEFIKTTRMNYSLLVGEREGTEAAARFGVSLVLPFSIFVASDGRVVAVKLGELHRDEAMAMLAAIRRLDQGQESLATTRQQIALRLQQLAAERARQAASTG